MTHAQGQAQTQEQDFSFLSDPTLNLPPGFKPVAGGFFRNPRVQGGVGGRGQFFSTEEARGRFGSDLGLIDQMARALFSDIGNQQAASDRQFERVGGAIDEFGELVGGISGRLEGQAAESAEVLGGVATGLEEKARTDVSDFEQRAGGLFGNIEGRVDEATATAKAARDEFRENIARFEDTSAQQASAAAFGMRANAKDQQNQIRSNPDLTPGQRAAAELQLERDTANQVQSAITPLQSRANETILNANGMLSQLGLQAAGTELQGAGLLAQTGTQLEAQRTQLVGQAQAQERFAAEFRRFGEQLKGAAALDAVRLEMAGRESIANLIAQNPETTVSLFAGLSALFAAVTAPGAQQVPGVTPAAFNQ